MKYLTTKAIGFSDIFKSDYLDNMSAFKITDAIIALTLAFIIGIFIYYVYQKTFNGVMYSSSFGTSLIAMCLITTFVILAVTSNVVLSLGMVGALSIVRFRTAIKEPIEIAYLFWSIASGIVIGAGLIPLAVIGSLLTGIIMALFVNRKTKDNPYILIVNTANDKAEKYAQEYIKNKVKKMALKSKTVSAGGIETTYEVRLNEMESQFVNELSASENVSNVVLVSYNGDYMS